MPASEGFSGFSEFSSDQPEVGYFVGDLVNDLGSRLTDLLHIQHGQSATSVTGQGADNNDASNRLRFEKLAGVKLESFCSGKGLSKCATFACPIKGKSLLSSMFHGEMDSDNDSTAQDLSQADHGRSDNYPCSHSFSLPTPLKLLSAMKGSREKSGAPPRKLAVSWAPDVYDPLPTSLSHVPKKSHHLRSNKKNGKNKQKCSSKGARGTKSKEKRKSSKYSGSSSPSFISVGNSLEDDDNKVAYCSGQQDNCVEYNVGKPDPFCGHSFLRKSVTLMHFPVAEAT